MAWRIAIKRKLSSHSFLKSLLILTLVCLATERFIRFYAIFLDDRFLLLGDNSTFLFPLMQYFGLYLKEFNAIPDWYFSNQGGVWFPVLVNNFLILSPHRLFGYLLIGLGVHPLLAYKVSTFFVGQALLLFGIYLCARQLFERSWVAVLAVLIAFFSSITVTLPVHETLLQVMFLPYIWLCLLRLHRSPTYLLWLGALVGISLNVHYPQFYLGYFLIIGLCSLFHWRGKFTGKNITSPKTLLCILLGLIFLAISGSPALYAYFNHKDQLRSPYRGTQSLSSNSYSSYLKFQDKLANGDPADLTKYVGLASQGSKAAPSLNDGIFFMTTVLPWALLILLLGPFPNKAFHLGVLCLLSLFTLGINGFVPRLLWNVVPGFSMFRQWIGFIAFLNPHLLFVVVQAIALVLEGKLSVSMRKILLCAGLGFLVLGFLNVLTPTYAYASAILCGLSFIPIPTPSRKTALGLGFTVVLLIGSYVWTHHLLSDYKHQILSGEYRYSSYFRHQSWLFGALPSMLVVPKNASKSWVSWAGKFGGKLVEHPSNSKRGGGPYRFLFSGDDGWLRVQVQPTPRGGEKFLLWQHDDGHWLVRGDEAKNVSIPSRSGSIEFLAQKGVSIYRIKRTKNIWTWLVFLMWLPIALLTLRACTKRVQKTTLRISLKNRSRTSTPQPAS